MRKTLKILSILGFIFVVIMPMGSTVVSGQNKTIKVGYEPNYGIINDPMVIGSEGYGYEYLSEIEKYTDLEFEYVPVTWKEGLEKLKTGEVDIFGPASLTENRQKAYNYIEAPFSNETANIYAPINSDLHYNEPEALNGLIFGTVEDSVYVDYFTQYAQKNNIHYTIKYVNYLEVTQAMESGEIDVYLDGSLYLQDGIKIVDEIYSEPLYLMTKKGNTTLSDEINKAMLKLETQVPYFNEVLWYKYYGGMKKAAQSFTEKEIIALEQKESYTVGYHSDLPPISYTAKDGTPKGYTVDIMNILAEKMDIKLDYIPLHDGKNHDRAELDFNLCILDDNDHANGAFSQPYYFHELMIIREKDILPQDVKNISTLAYSNIQMEEHLGLYTEAKINKVYSDAESKKLIKNYDVECYAALEGRAQMLLDAIGAKDYTVEYSGVKVPLTITVSNDLSIHALSALNKAISSLRESEVEELIAANVVELQPELTLYDYIVNNIWQTMLVVAISVYGVFYFYIRIMRKNEKHLRNLLEVDELTGLMTVRKLATDMAEILKTAKPNEYCLVSFDIDNFKDINQIYGYEKGNDVLRALADAMRKYASEDALLCHYNSDVFLVFAKARNVSVISAYTAIFSQKRCDEIMNVAQINATLHISTGVYYFDDTSLSLDLARDYARKARTIAKQKHGNTVVIYSSEIKKKSDREREIYNSMEKAIEAQEYFIVIQPKIELLTGKIVGGEVLVRWKKPDGTFIYPDEFIPLFEKNQFIEILDKYVFEEACRFVQVVKGTMPRLSVNVSAVTALSENFLNDYIEILEHYKLSPGQFELELTESALSDDFGKVADVVRQAKEIGFHLSIDDFGVGASSLARIKELKVDAIKLDKGFLNDQSDAEKGRVVIESIISMANSLGFVTLAEGVETQEDLEMLIELGCDLGQGYWFDKPLSAEEYLKKVKADALKEYPEAIKPDEKIKGYLTDFDNLPYGIAVCKNIPTSNIIKANKMFYDIIGHTKEQLWDKHENKITEIILEDLYFIVKEIPTDKNYTIEFDIRIRTFNGEIVWVHDYVQYDSKQNLFFITFTDITKQMLPANIDLPFMSYQAQKESLLFINDLTSDYIAVSDVKTDEIVFMNENGMKLCGFEKQSDWLGKKYKELAYGKDLDKNEEYYVQLNEKGFASRDYYNHKHKRYFHVENKIITVLGFKMRLDILTDITEKKKVESEILLQNTLHNCVEHLYTASYDSCATSNSFNKMLEELRKYYHADRAYYFEFFKEKNVASNLYEAVRHGVKSKIKDFQSIPLEAFGSLWSGSISKTSVYVDAERIKSNETLLNISTNYEISSLLILPIRDSADNVVGFLGLDNPADNVEHTELMSLLSKFVWMFIKNLPSKKPQETDEKVM